MFLKINDNYLYKSRLYKKLEKNDLAECKKNYDCYIMNLDTLQYYNPEDNVWKNIPVKENDN